MVWLCALTFALGGVFLVKYSIDQGFVSPSVRVLMGVCIGTAAVALGEYLRRRWLGDEEYSQDVPAALVAGGVGVAFASIYGAYALYGLLSPMSALRYE